MTAATALDIIHVGYENGNQLSQNGECDGLRVTDSTYINRVILRYDMDYHQAYLIEVCDNLDGETWVSYLAVYQRHAGLGNIDFAWHESRRRFFDIENNQQRDAMMWFVHWTDDEDMNSCLKNCVRK